MKTISILFAALVIAYSISSIAGAGDSSKSGFFFGPEFKTAGILRDYSRPWQPFIGGHAGWAIEGRSESALAAYGMISERGVIYFPPGMDFMSRDIKLFYGGLRYRHIIEIGSVERVAFGMLLGVGRISLESVSFDEDNYPDLFFVAEPGIDFLLVFSNNFEAGIGLGYQITKDVSLLYMDDSDLSGSTIRIFSTIGIY